MLPRTLSSKTNGTWGTSATAPASPDELSSRTSAESSRTAPDSGSTSRTASDAIVDLPAPVAPTSATVRPAGTVNETSCSTAGPPAYRNVTPSNRSCAGPVAAGSAEP
jgi:hypothetical protein